MRTTACTHTDTQCALQDSVLGKRRKATVADESEAGWQAEKVRETDHQKRKADARKQLSSSSRNPWACVRLDWWLLLQPSRSACVFLCLDVRTFKTLVLVSVRYRTRCPPPNPSPGKRSMVQMACSLVLGVPPGKTGRRRRGRGGRAGTGLVLFVQMGWPATLWSMPPDREKR